MVNDLNLDSFLNSFAAPVFVIDEQGLVEFSNDAALGLFGYQESEMLGQNITKIIPQELKALHDGYIQTYLKTKVKKIIGIGRDVLAINCKGEKIPVHLTVYHHQNPLGEKHHFIGILNDISKVEKTEANLKAIFEAASSTIIFIDDQMTIQYINHTRFGKEDLKNYPGTMLTSHYHDEASIADANRAFKEARETKTTTECRVFHRGATFEVKMSPIFISGAFKGAVGIFTNIEGILKQKEDLEKLLEEKETLLKEVFHRVRNNFQVVTSLLSLQLNQTKVAEAKTVIGDVRTRILALSSIHDMIYGSSSIESIDLAVYLQKICQNVQSSFDEADTNFTIQSVPFEGQCFVSPNEAVACGAILSEFIMNSMKHAAKQGNKVNACYALYCREDLHSIGYCDDGEYYKSIQRIQSTVGNLGTKIIRSFAENLGAQLENPLFAKWVHSFDSNQVIPETKKDSYCATITFTRKK